MSPKIASKPAAKSKQNGVDPRSRAQLTLKRLRKEFPEAATALLHQNPFQLLIATILSAQCTDERVNMVTPGLFRKYPTPKHFATANQAELEKDIRSTGFYRMKAKNIIGCSKGLLELYKGIVPKAIDQLVVLPGVGRKTANVVLGQAFGIASGVVVDTHVHRLSQRLGFTRKDDPVNIEKDLMELFPSKDWIDLGSMLILHGRKTCKARKPLCAECKLNDVCPSAVL